MHTIDERAKNVQTTINKTGITLGKHRQAGADNYKTAELV